MAKKLGESCGLLLVRENGVNHEKLADLEERMRWFQQMSVTSSFEDCVAVYFGMELTEEQVSVLKLIHRTTKPWMTGHVVGVLLDKIDDGRMQNKDFAEAVRVLVDQLDTEGSGELGRKMQGIILKPHTGKAA